MEPVGAAAGAALRAGQLLFLQQTVPFTYRKHTLILPVGIELLMGDATFKQQIGGYAQAGKLLKENNSDYQLIQGIAKRVIAAVGKEYGGGFQKHVAKFKWEVVVVDDKVPNAFVLPGGKIVVFTGLLLCIPAIVVIVLHSMHASRFWCCCQVCTVSTRFNLDVQH